jgi:hypothetical protein
MSKALVTDLVGSEDGLSSERAHVVRTLPRGVLAGLRRRDAAGAGRAAAILAGTAVTAGGYLRGRLALRVRARG